MTKNNGYSPKRLPVVKGSFAEVPLTRGAVAKVSTEDVEWVSKHNWNLSVRGYASCRHRYAPGKSKHFYLHREVMREQLSLAPAGYYVDHINGDRLDNRRENLRVVSPSHNGVNRHKERSRRRRDPGHRGVCYVPELNKRNPWISGITKDRKPIHLGYFPTAEAAGEAYRKAAVDLFGEYSNFYNAQNNSSRH